jgi:hypothetical protein
MKLYSYNKITYRVVLGKGEVDDRPKPHPKIRPHPKKF